MARSQLNQYYKKAFQDFTGGLNTQDAALVTAANQFKQLDNFVVNDRGLLEKIEGYSIDGSPFPDDADSFIRMLVNYKRGTSVDRLICSALDEGNTNASYKVDLKETSGDGSYSYIGYVTGTASFTNANTAVVGVGTAWASHLKAGDKIKADAHAEGTWAEIQSVTNDTNLVLTANYSGATVAGAAYKARIILHKDYIPSSVVYNDNLIITNGSEKPMSFNSTTLTTITDTDAPKGKFIEAHKNRVFIAHTSGGPSTVYWSAANDETAWDAASLEPIFTKDGGNICAIKSFADSLVVLKDNGKIYQIVGDFDQSTEGAANFIRKVDTPENIGTIAGYTAVVGNDNRLYFLAESGYYGLNRGMGLQKLSWDIDPTTSSVVLRSGALASKALAYDTQTQFDSGTHNGTMATAAGVLRPYFDQYTISDAYKSNKLCAIATDSSQSIHIAYVNSSNNKIVKYAKYASDGTLTSETAATIPDSYTFSSAPYPFQAIRSLSIDVASNGNVCIGVGVGWVTLGGNYLAVAYGVVRSSGSWGSLSTMTELGSANDTTTLALSVKYRSDNAARSIVVFNDNSSTLRDYYYGLSGSTWSLLKDIGSWTTTQPATDGFVDLVLNSSDNPRVVYRAANTNGGAADRVRHMYSNDDGTNWTTATLTTNITAVIAGPFAQVTSGGDFYFAFGGTYSASSQVVRYNVTGAAATVIDSGTNALHGYVLNSSNQDTTYESTSTSSGTERYYYNQTVALTNASSTLSTSFASTTTGSKGLVLNSNVYCSIAFGANADEIIARRLSFVSTWKSDEVTDSGLTAWGLAEIDATINSVTTTYTAALASSDQGADPLGDGTYTSTLVDGNIVSSDATLVYASVRVGFTLTAFIGAEVDSIILNYTGTGIGPQLPASVVFDNEIYTSNASSGDNNNTAVLIYDKSRVFTRVEYPVIFMVRYKSNLYGGMSTTGKVVKLRNTFGFNGTSYTGTAISKEDLLGSLELEKDIHKIYVIYETKSAGTFTFSHRVDNFKNASGSTWTDTTITQTATSTTPGFAEILVGKTGTSIQFKITNASASNEVAVVGWVIRYSFLNVR